MTAGGADLRLELHLVRGRNPLRESRANNADTHMLDAAQNDRAGDTVRRSTRPQANSLGFTGGKPPSLC